jgi:hypothetical protein
VPSCDATSPPDDNATFPSSSEKGKDNIHALVAGHAEASECITDKEHTVASQDDIHCTSSLASPHRAETYWDSPKARKLVRPLASSEPTVLAASDNQIKALRQVSKSSNTHKDITGNFEELNEDDIPEHQEWVTQQKAQYLALSLQLAKEKMNASWTWGNAVNTQSVN